MNHCMKDSFKNRNNRPIPTGKGVKMISHIGELSFSTTAPKVTTHAPMIIACQIDNPFVKKISPKKYERLVSNTAVIKLL